jgi:hypothetical protein
METYWILLIAVLKSDNASLESQINELCKMLSILWDHCPTEPVCKQRRKSLIDVKRPHMRIQPAIMPHLEFMDLRILLHFQKNLLIEKLPWVLHQLFLPPKYLYVTLKKTNGLKTVTCRKKTTTGGPPVITVKHRWKPFIVVQSPASLPVISKKERFKTILVSILSPEVAVRNVEKSLKEQLSLKKLVYLTLKQNFTLTNLFSFWQLKTSLHL